MMEKQEIIIKTIGTKKTPNENFELAFYVQARGYNAGMPKKEKLKNGNFEIWVQKGVTRKEFLFYFWTMLFDTYAFRPYIIGSVVPFITIEGITKALRDRKV